MPSQAHPKQRSLFDFLRLFNHVFQLTDHPKPFSTEAVAKSARPALTKQPDPRHPCLGRLSRLAPAAPKRQLKPLPKPPVGFVFGIRAPRNRFGNHFHQPA